MPSQEFDMRFLVLPSFSPMLKFVDVKENVNEMVVVNENDMQSYSI